MAEHETLESETETASIGALRQPEGKEGRRKPNVPKKPSVNRSKESLNVPDSRINDPNTPGNQSQNSESQEMSQTSQEPRKNSQESDTFRNLIFSSLTSNTDYTGDRAHDKETSQRPTHLPVRDSKPLYLPKPRPITEYGGSVGYCRVKMGGESSDDNRTSASSSEDDEVHEVDASVGSGVQHLHIHINLHFTKNSKNRQRKVKGNRFSKQEETTRKTIHHSINNLNANGQPETTANRTDIPDGEAPPVPPKLPPKTYKSCKMTSNSNTDYLTTKESENPEDDYEECERPVYARSKHRDYDEITLTDEHLNESVINENLECPDAVEIDKTEKFQSSLHPQNEPQDEFTETNYPWLFHYTQRRSAEEKIRTDKNGSFVVIKEDLVCMPFTPYTFMAVHEGQLIKIPVLHQLKLGKGRYALVNSPEIKKKSIQDIVSYYQGHEIPCLKIRLRPPD